MCGSQILCVLLKTNQLNTVEYKDIRWNNCSVYAEKAFAYVFISIIEQSIKRFITKAKMWSMRQVVNKHQSKMVYKKGNH